MGEIKLSLLLLFLVKIVDNLIGTGRTLLIQKQKDFLAALSVVISQVIFFAITSKVIASNDIKTMWIVSIGAGIGTYLAMQVSKKFSQERMYISSILSDDKEAMIELSQYLKENKIKNLITDSYTKDWGKTLTITVYADTRARQALLDEFIKKSTKKYLKINN